MTERDLLERIDAHLARIDAHLARSGELMVRIDGHLARSEVLMEQIREEMQRSRERAARNAELEDTRAFMSSLLARFDRRVRDCTRHLHERRYENRESTQALLSILDRLEPGGATG